MTSVTVQVDIDAPVEQTWAVVTDWERQGEWMPMTQVDVTDHASAGLGAKLSARSGAGPMAFVDPMVVDVWQPPHRCEVVHLGQVVTGRGIFRVDPLPGNRSRFSWEEVLDGDGLRGLVDRLGALPTRLLLTIAVRRLARLVAAETP
jgi:Polyketide cyclase / dehydrase and lipid transport